MQANKTLKPYGLQLYLYLASNSDNYTFALSPVAAEEYAGIKATTFRKYLRLLETEGYLVWNHGNTYDFYTSPRDPEHRTDPDNHCDKITFEDETVAARDDQDTSPCENTENASRKSSASDDHGISSHDSNCSPSNREIDNRYTDNNRKAETANIYAGKPRTPASSDAGASASPSKVKQTQYQLNTDEFGNFRF